ncbi:MAG: hypothetical protein J6M05_04850 [Cardiobacteriaceae bacterium]|nr:hypothetical protein [Cardiobacteriaceae bacterium]
MFKKLILVFVLFIFHISFAEKIHNGVITKDERCKIANENLSVLSDLSRPIYTRDINGNKVELTYAEILKKRQDSEKIIRTVCSYDNFQYQQEERSFGSNLINKAKGGAQKDSIEIAIEQALRIGDYDEIATIMELVLDIPRKDIENFIKIAKRKNPADALSLFSKQYRNKARNKNPQYDPNKTYSATGNAPKVTKVDNMKNFMKTTQLGKEMAKNSVRTGNVYKGEQIYKATGNIAGKNIAANDYFYLDSLHRDHFEVFNADGTFKRVINLDGTVNTDKTEKAKKSGRTIKIK